METNLTLALDEPMDWTKKHPVSAVRWVPTDQVYANDYNPNAVAPPEMKLLRISIEADGFTQPIVTMKTDQGYEVIDGFHRHLVGKQMGLSHLPVVVIAPIAKTIRPYRCHDPAQPGARKTPG